MLLKRRDAGDYLTPAEKIDIRRGHQKYALQVAAWKRDNLVLEQPLQELPVEPEPLPVEEAGPEEPLVFTEELLRDLVAEMDGGLTFTSPAAAAAWHQLYKNFGPKEEVPVVNSEAPPAIGWDDPGNSCKAVVIKALPGGKWLVRPHRISRHPEGVLRLYGRQKVKANWVITVKPAVSEGGGYLLVGDYNRYGERLA